MSDNNESRETVSDIVAMLRKQSDEERALATRLRRTDDDVDFALASCYAEDAKYLSQIADRLEAAAKRDEERAVEHATRHAEAVARDNCRDCVYNPRGKNYEGGNAAAMREALDKAHRVLHCAIIAGILRGDDAYDAMNMAAAALAAPPRNCDLARDWLQDLYCEFKPPATVRREMPPEWVDAVMAFCKWLLAPAAEREGEGDDA